MANEQNLHPSEYKLSQEEAKKGGIASGAVRRAQKMIRAIGFARPFSPEECEQLEKVYGVSAEDISNLSLMATKQLQQALAGNTAAYTAFIKSAGLWVDKVEATGADGTPLMGAPKTKDEAFDYLANAEKK